MADHYWERIGKFIKYFSEPGDTLKCIEIVREEHEKTCQLCEHFPIYWVYTLKNMRTQKTIDIGRECIHNYKIVFEKMNESPVQIIFPEKFANAALEINKKRPGTVNIQPTIDEDSEESEDLELGADSWEDYDIDDLAPEGTSLDEIDWDSFDWDRD